MAVDASVYAAALVAGGSSLATWLTVRSNRQGARATATLEERKANRDDFDLFTSKLERQMDRDRADYDRKRAEDKAEFEATLGVQRQALSHMREELDTEYAQRILSNTFSRALLVWAQDHAKACPGLPPPPALPEGMNPI